MASLFNLIGVRASIGEGNGTPLQYSCLENPMDGGAWWAAVHGVAKSQTRLSDFTFTFHFHALEKEMATHSSVLAWRIPGMGEPGGLPSMGSHRVRHDWINSAAAGLQYVNFGGDAVQFASSTKTLCRHAFSILTLMMTLWSGTFIISIVQMKILSWDLHL